MVHSENQWRHHGYHAYPGVDAQAASAAAVRGGLLIALRADVFAAEEVRDIVDIVLGKAMALDVVTAGGTLTVINVHGPGSGGDSWASKASFWADVAMYAAAKSAGGTRAVLLRGDFNVWLESPWHPTTRRFQALWEQCGFHRAGPEREEDRRPTRAGHRLDSFFLNSPLVPWAARERPHLAPGRSPASLGSDHGPVVLDIPLAVAGKERVTRMAYSLAQGRLHAIRPYSPGVREAAAAVLQKACGDRRLQAWLSSDQDTATMGTSEVQAVFDLLYAFRDDVSRVTGVRMPSGVDPQYPYGHAETEASLDQVLSDQQALAWRPSAVATGRGGGRTPLPGKDCPATPPPASGPRPVPHLGRGPACRIGPSAPLAGDTRGGAAGCPQEQQAPVHQGVLAGQGTGSAAPMDGDTGGHQRSELCPVRPMVRTRPRVGEGALGGLRRHR